jgi:hypothetical protein
LDEPDQDDVVGPDDLDHGFGTGSGLRQARTLRCLRRHATVVIIKPAAPAGNCG